jgi:hypothetical protein
MKPGSIACLALLLVAAAAPRAYAGIGQDDIAALLDLHDAERCAVDPPAASMPAMQWNALLATVAQTYADGCVYAHNANRTQQYQAVGGSGYVGENIAEGTEGFFSLLDLAQFWADEKADWTFGPIANTGGPATGHYTQMIWADTLTIGCGAASCSGMTYLVCDYSPGGNYLGETPYTAGVGTNEACHAPEPAQALAMESALVSLAALQRKRLARGARAA